MTNVGSVESSIASYETFKLVRRNHFSVSCEKIQQRLLISQNKHVKKPSTTRLGKCGTCTELKQRRLKCKTSADVQQLKMEIVEHTAKHYSERLPYHERRLLASIHPSCYMSIILDKTKDIWLPHLIPFLKSAELLQLLKVIKPFDNKVSKHLH